MRSVLAVLKSAAALKSGFTGGQYSLYRALLGTYLVVRFTMLLPWAGDVSSSMAMPGGGGAGSLLRFLPNVLHLSEAPWCATALVSVGVLASAAFAIGLRGRVAALVAWYAGACLLGRNALLVNQATQYVGWLLLVHACLPAAPFGSWDARDRVDPGGGWGMPRLAWGGAWALMAAGYALGGVAKLGSPSWLDGSALSRVLSSPIPRPTFLRDALAALPSPHLVAATYAALAAEILFAPAALFRRARPVAWCLLLLMHVGLMTTLDFVDLSLGMVFLHLFTFDPEWLPARRAPAAETVFYDGTCGLCHGLVRFLLAEDRAAAFVYAPLGGIAFSAAIPAAERSRLPDSIVLRTDDGRTLVRSAAIVHALERLGGAWRALAFAFRIVPRPVRDAGYDGVAAIRRRLVAAPKSACPLLPPHLRARFLA